MDLATIIQKALALKDAVTAKQYRTAFKLALELLTAAADFIPETAADQPVMMGSAVMSKSAEELCADIDACCTGMHAAGPEEVGKNGELIKQLLPIIISLLTKFLI